MTELTKRRKQIKDALLFKFHVPKKQVTVVMKDRCLVTTVQSFSVDVQVTASLVGRTVKMAAVATMGVFGSSASIRD